MLDKSAGETAARIRADEGVSVSVYLSMEATKSETIELEGIERVPL